MLKLARKYQADLGHPERNEIVACHNSFHGRTMFALAATGQPKYHHGFEPLVPGVRHIPFGDVAALEAALTDTTAAFIVEPIQGEAGVFPAPAGYLDGGAPADPQAGACCSASTRCRSAWGAPARCGGTSGTAWCPT